MYNSPLKYFLKGLTGRKNDMWYFDKLEKSFSKSNRLLSNQLYEEALNYKVGVNNNYLKNHSDVYSLAHALKDELLSSYLGKYKNSEYVFLIQTPPIHFSPSGNSIFANLLNGLNFCGIRAKAFWDIVDDNLINKNCKIIVFSGSGKFNNIQLSKSGLFEFAKSKNIPIVLGITIPLLGLKTDFDLFIQDNITEHTMFCYSYNDDAYIEKSQENKWVQHLNLPPIFSFPFSFNPLIHFPIPTAKQKVDYVFLGSTNHDKIGRYNQFFQPIFKSPLKGLVFGPGWKWCTNKNFNFTMDRYVYAAAKVGLNLHIEQQINNPTEFNERYYQLAAFGILQLSDNPGLLKKHNPASAIIASQPDEYLRKLIEMIMSPNSFEKNRIDGLKNVYAEHSIFHRIDSLMQYLHRYFN